MPRIIAWYTKCSKWNESSQKLWSIIYGWKCSLDFINPAKSILINKIFQNYTWQNHVFILHASRCQQVLANLLIVLRRLEDNRLSKPWYIRLDHFCGINTMCIFLFMSIWMYMVFLTPIPSSNNPISRIE